MNPEIDEDGNKFWINEDGGHREDGPAIEYTDGEKRWMIDGKLHRTDGPARTWSNGTEEDEWWLNGTYYFDFEAWLEDVDASLEQKIILKLRYG